MPFWKILAIIVFGCVSLGLAFATVMVPMTLETKESPWLWVLGLFSATVIVGTLFVLFLRSADRAMARDPARSRYR